MYPQFMRPLVPGRGSNDLSSVMDSYLLMVNHMQRKGVARVKDQILTFNAGKAVSPLDKKEEKLVEFFTENYPIIPAVPSGSARESFLRKYQEKVLKLWPMLTDTQQITADAKAFMEYQLPVVFYPPTVHDKNISSELRQLLEYAKKRPYVNFESYSKSFKKLASALKKKNLSRNYEYTSEGSGSYLSSVYPERDAQNLIAKNSNYVKELKQTPWNAIKTRYHSFKFWAISTAYVGVPATMLTAQMPEVAVPLGFFGLIGVTVHSMVYGMNFKKSRYLKLTDEGKTLLKQVEAWENFKDSNVHRTDQYEIVNLKNTTPISGEERYRRSGKESDYYLALYARQIRDMETLQRLMDNKSRKNSLNTKKNSYNPYTSKY